VFSLEERLVVPAYASRRSALWVNAYLGLQLPLQLAAEARACMARSGTGELRVVCVGRARRVQPTLRRLFNEVEPREALWPVAGLGPGSLSRLEAPLVIAEVHRWAAPRFRRAGWIVVPSAVRWHAELSVVPRRGRRSVEKDLRLVRRGDFSVEPVRDGKAWEEFYQTMVRPNAQARFGEEAWLPSRYLLRKLAAVGTLLYIRMGGVRVAGCYVVPTARGAWSPVAGMLNGDRELLRKGVAAATYTLVFDWVRSQGIDHLDFGRTTPFANDGIFRYKEKWGLVPVPDPLARTLALRVAASSPELRERFVAEPVLIETDEGLQLYTGDEIRGTRQVPLRPAHLSG
jgi:hypothetical protein